VGGYRACGRSSDPRDQAPRSEGGLYREINRATEMSFIKRARRDIAEIQGEKRTQPFDLAPKKSSPHIRWGGKV